MSAVVRRLLMVLALLLCGLVTVPPPAAAAPERSVGSGECAGRSAQDPDAMPVLAHFYLWFTAGSWNRAKTDYPALGRYSSDQVSVMREQVAQARAAGITGFIVGWRSTETLNRRLTALRHVAAAQDFSLAITYQAQDFNRDPLPVAQVRSDLAELATTYADDPVFHTLGDRPLVALSGTWHYSADELRSITEPVASRLLVLATEKDVAGYERVADAVDGELYYWSSADPDTTPGHRQKLVAMAHAVHGDCGIWVAPVAPGFDARLVGGDSVVARRDGNTLRTSWEAAMGSDPDAIGIISWNEFSENTHIEPSTTYGARYLEVLSELTGAPPSALDDLDSSGPEGPGSQMPATVSVAAVLGFLLLVGIAGVRRRRAGAGR
jgi:MYXO-CTERM domain-containing protein